MQITMPVTYFEDNGEVEVIVAVPAKWIICEDCNGTGGSSAYLGAYTSSEWHEQDAEFRDNYMAGRYDRTCECCRGTGKVLTLDDNATLTPEQSRALEGAEEDARINAEIDAEHAAERRMGC